MEYGATYSDFDRMMAEDFWEVGASGKRYSRALVLATLAKRLPLSDTEHWVVTDFVCRHISGDTYLVTYRLEQDGGRLSRRSTLWQRAEGDWKALYHQGTLIAVP